MDEVAEVQTPESDFTKKSVIMRDKRRKHFKETRKLTEEEIAEKISRLTPAQYLFVQKYKLYAKEYSKPQYVLKMVSTDLNLGLRTTKSYRYSHKKIKEILDNVPLAEGFRELPSAEGLRKLQSKEPIDWTVNEIIRQYELLLDRIPEEETKQRKEVIDSIKSTVKDFGERFSTELKAIKGLSMEELLDKTQNVFEKLYGNKRVAEMFRSIMERPSC